MKSDDICEMKKQTDHVKCKKRVSMATRESFESLSRYLGFLLLKLIWRCNGNVATRRARLPLPPRGLQTPPSWLPGMLEDFPGNIPPAPLRQAAALQQVYSGRSNSTVTNALA